MLFLGPRGTLMQASLNCIGHLGFRGWGVQSFTALGVFGASGLRISRDLRVLG